jgi:UDP-2,4-diacetamido-2,4,6-trideoxy-beta-L-altropyranose hydrolase
MGRTALFRANANVQIGTGHLLRSLALAQAWNDAGGEAVLLTEPGAADTEHWWLDNHFPIEHLTAQTGGIEDARATLQAAQRIGADWVVVDGFDFGEAYQQVVSGGMPHMLVIDDYAAQAQYGADIIVNHNVFGNTGMYKGRADRSELLLGLQYALLRRQFRNLQIPERTIPMIAHRVLVTMGGSDPLNVSMLVVEALKRSQVPDLQVTVLLGPANPHHEAFERITNEVPFTLVLRESVLDMVNLITDADAVVSAGGGTCAELALLRTPMLLLTIAENHALTVEEYGRQCFAVAGGWFDRFTPATLAQKIDSLLSDYRLRQSLVDHAASQVDGQGAMRVANRMWQMSSE